MKIYIGNLTAQTRSPQLRALFSPHGPVQSARLARSQATDALRGYAIVEMDDEDQGLAAIAALHGMSIDGQAIRVTRAGQSRRRQEEDGRSGAADGREPVDEHLRSSEAGRVWAEDRRREAERERSRNESWRLEAETARGRAEDARQIAEEARKEVGRVMERTYALERLVSDQAKLIEELWRRVPGMPRKDGGVEEGKH